MKLNSNNCYIKYGGLPTGASDLDSIVVGCVGKGEMPLPEQIKRKILSMPLREQIKCAAPANLVQLLITESEYIEFEEV